MAENDGAFGHRPRAMVFAALPGRQSELAELARLSGCSANSFDSTSACDFLLTDLRSETDTHRDSFSKIVEYLSRHRSEALVWTDMDGLEDAFAALPPEQCHFLIDASDSEAVPILALLSKRGGMDRLHDRNRRTDFGSLHRISDELAEFARTLARMAEDDNGNRIADKPVSFRPAPVGGFQGFPVAAASLTVDAKAVREIIKKRRLRDRYFEGELFADPAWDILLDLKAASLERQNVSVSSLCIAAAVPPTTALRWITAMTESGMLIRRQDPDDARRVFIDLSQDTAAKLDDYFAASLAQPGPIVG